MKRNHLYQNQGPKRSLSQEKLKMTGKGGRSPSEKDVKEAVKETWTNIVRNKMWEIVSDDKRWTSMVNRHLAISKNMRPAKPEKVLQSIDQILQKEWERCNVHMEFRSKECDSILNEIAKVFT